MTHPLPADSDMTDVFGRFQSTPPAAGELSGAAISNRKKALLSTAAVLLGAGATFAAINLDAIRTYVEENEDATTPDVVPPAPENASPVEPAATTAPVRHHTASAVQSGLITPNEHIAIAGLVREPMSFGEAYATAREEVGPGGIFSWHGQVYNTFTVEEWQGLSLAQRQEFLSDVGYRPTQDTEKMDEVGADGSQIVENGGSELTAGAPTDPTGATPEPVDVEPAYTELMINGRPALGIDDDHDGIANAIVFLDEETDSLVAFVDAEGDNRIDTVVQFDAASQEIVGQQALEDPFLAPMSRLEAMSGLGYEEENVNYMSLVSQEGGTLEYDDDDNDYTDDNGYVNDAELPDMD